jgi:ABC-2 type transport system permease protein
VFFRTLWAFLRRDATIHTSYKVGFTLDLTTLFFNATMLYFLSKLVGPAAVPALERYGGDYFAFLILGFGSSTFQNVGLNSFQQSLRQEQFLNTLEPVLLTPVTIPQFLFGSALWDFLYATLQVGLYLLIGWAVFDLTMPNANPAPALAVLALTFISFMGLGILSAAFIMRFKRGTPITWLITVLGDLLGGVFYPVGVFPEWLEKVSLLVPMRHALDAVRRTLLAGAGWEDILPQLGALAVFCVVLWPIGVWAFTVALKRSRRDGTLGHY